MTDTVVIDLPATWTMAMWDCYIDGENKYSTEARALKHSPNGSHLMFSGALALIRERYVRVSGPEVVTAWLDGRPIDDIPLQIVGYFNDQIGGAIETAINAPLSDYLKTLSATSPIPSATPVQAA